MRGALWDRRVKRGGGLVATNGRRRRRIRTPNTPWMKRMAVTKEGNLPAGVFVFSFLPETPDRSLLPPPPLPPSSSFSQRLWRRFTVQREV